MIVGSEGGWRPAVRSRGAVLLNERWHKSARRLHLPRCPVCDHELPAGDHAVHHGGEIFHSHCLLYEGGGRER